MRFRRIEIQFPNNSRTVDLDPDHSVTRRSRTHQREVELAVQHAFERERQPVARPIAVPVKLGIVAPDIPVRNPVMMVIQQIFRTFAHDGHMFGLDRYLHFLRNEVFPVQRYFAGGLLLVRFDQAAPARTQVPVSRRSVIDDGPQVMPELHIEPQRSTERNPVQHPQPGILHESGAIRAGAFRLGDERMVGNTLAPSPGVTVIVLASGSQMRRERLSVHIDFFVAFAPPGVFGIEQRQAVADINALSVQRDEAEIGRTAGIVRILMLVPSGRNSSVLMPRSPEMHRPVVPFPRSVAYPTVA